MSDYEDNNADDEIQDNILLESDSLSKDSLNLLTEQMLFSIWESHMGNDDQDSAKKIYDEIYSRGFVIRERNGKFHLYKKPKTKLK